MPNVLNCNPQSLYNKPEEFITLLQEREIDAAFISESWERDNHNLEDLLSSLKNYTVLSDYNQRKSRGGRPALILNNDKFFVQNFTGDTVKVPWGCEIIWALLTPKTKIINSPVKRIVCAAVYSKPC